MLKHILVNSVLLIFLNISSFLAAQTLDKETAINLALKNNPRFSVSISQIQNMEGKRIQAGLRPNPEAVLELENFAGTNQREGFENVELTFALEQKIELAGKRRIRTEIADFNHMIVREKAIDEALRIISETEYAFIRMAIAKENVDLSEKRLKLADETLDLVRKRVAAAISPEMQYLKAEIEKNSAEIVKRNAETEYVNTRNELANLLGLESGDELVVEEDLSTLPLPVDRQLLIRSLQSAPQVRIHEYLKRQSRSSLDLAKATGIPDPTVGLGIRQFFDNDDTALVALLSFPLPLFDRNQGEIKSALANITKTDAVARANELSLLRNALNTLETFNTRLDETNYYKNKIIPNAHKAYEQAEYGFNRGAFSFLDLLDAQRTLNEVQSDYLEIISLLYKSGTQIDFLMGTHKKQIEKILKLNSGGEINEQ